MSKNHIIWHKVHVTRQDRAHLNNHESGLVWLTGLSASGKSTIAHAVEKRLFEQGVRTYVLDGDNVRHGINSNLGFSREDRKENLRRIVEVSKLFMDAGIMVLAAFISPWRDDREFVRKSFEGDCFIEVYVKCPIEECERRDPKGQYAKARAGIIKNYTGISSPYEEPENAEIVLDTLNMELEDCVNAIIRALDSRGVLPRKKGV
ncbi:MAG: adenylyl-sulfate kinase [Nitrospiraceae bacterium]|nr:adenylyl-sulfate kinase [Nitrospiraceae bacterium]